MNYINIYYRNIVGSRTTLEKKPSESIAYFLLAKQNKFHD